MNDLRYYKDIYDLGRYNLLNWEDAKVKFSLEKIHQGFWLQTIEFYGPFWEKMLNQKDPQLT